MGGRMPAPASIEAFLDLGYQSGLLDHQLVEEYRQRVPPSEPRPQSAEQLAQAMIRDGLLTPFQAESLLAGKWRGFLISNKYRLLHKVGSGGMGCVYLCE